MANFFFKNRVRYGNGEFAKDVSYYKLSEEGKIISLSNTKRTLSSPQSVIIHIGFEIISENEFEEAKKELGF